ncbi:MAG: SURF1 family protein [Paracoccaceae bacterium]
MTRAMIAPLLFGLLGAAVLVSLGIWQVQRLAWKEGVLTRIEARIGADPVPVPDLPTSDADGYLPVEVTGRLGEEEVHVLVSRKQIGAGYRIITSLDTGSRRFLLDRGFIPEEDRDAPRALHDVTVVGNLHWPDDRTSATPANDVDGNIWFARDIAALAAQLHTEPVLIIARSDTGDGIEPLPVNTAAVPNDHLQYAITWFSLAAVWLGMTAYLLWRIKRHAG